MFVGPGGAGEPMEAGMGWFLPGRVTGSRAGRAGQGRGQGRGRGRSGAGPRPWEPGRTLLALRWCGWIAVAVGVVVGWVFLEEALVRYASVRHAGAPAADAVVLVDRPGWMSDAVADQLAAVVGRSVGGDPLDGVALRSAVGALAADPWVREVRQVQRTADGRLRVSAVYREPVAVVRTGDGYVLVDRDRTRLPGLFARHQVPLLGLPEVVGVMAPAPAVGGRWRGDDLAAGLALVALVADQPFAGQIEAVDVAGRDGRGRLSLSLLAGRRTIRWGLPPGQGVPIEPADDATKLRRLARLAAAPGGLAGDARVAELNAVGGIRLHRGPLGTAEARGVQPGPR